MIFSSNRKFEELEEEVRKLKYKIMALEGEIKQSKYDEKIKTKEEIKEGISLMDPIIDIIKKYQYSSLDSELIGRAVGEKIYDILSNMKIKGIHI